MSEITFLDVSISSIRNKLASVILVANAFIWYFYAFNIVTEMIRRSELPYSQVSVIWVLNFTGTAILMLAGAVVMSKIGRRIPFLLTWMVMGVISSLIPMTLNTSVETNILGIAFLFGAVFGLGVPAVMGYFASSTLAENRASLGGIIFFAISLGLFLLGMISVKDIETNLVILTIWRTLGLVAFVMVRPTEGPFDKSENLSYIAILNKKAFLLYFIAWSMFCLIDQTTAPITMNYFGEDFINFSIFIEGVLSGAFSITSGFFCDRIGRKRVTMLGFVMLGIGYGSLGIFPYSMSWYIYSITDGIAWGVFYTVFFMTIWGDLAYDKPGEKFYALGELPYLLSNFLRFMVGTLIVEAVFMYAIFSLASLFLFLAVLPLLYAPETLPEKRIKDRELKGYIEKAKKIKEKYL